jgi:DNA invertase Pin-like site-specific DNA recombinase
LALLAKFLACAVTGLTNRRWSVSTDGQTLAAQDAQLHAAGCAKIYSEKVSGARTDRVELGKLLKRLDEGDVLIVTRLDRLARSTRDLLTLDTVAKAGASYCFACSMAASSDGSS